MTVTVVSQVEAPAALSATAVTVAPSSEQLSPPPTPAPTSTPTPEIMRSPEEPTGTPQTSHDFREQVRAWGDGGTTERRQFARNQFPCNRNQFPCNADGTTLYTCDRRGSPAKAGGPASGAPPDNQTPTGSTA